MVLIQLTQNRIRLLVLMNTVMKGWQFRDQLNDCHLLNDGLCIAKLSSANNFNVNNAAIYVA